MQNALYHPKNSIDKAHIKNFYIKIMYILIQKSIIPLNQEWRLPNNWTARQRQTLNGKQDHELPSLGLQRQQSLKTNHVKEQPNSCQFLIKLKNNTEKNTAG